MLFKIFFLTYSFAASLATGYDDNRGGGGGYSGGGGGYSGGGGGGDRY
jgi:CspA family cold shock protein